MAPKLSRADLQPPPGMLPDGSLNVVDEERQAQRKKPEPIEDLDEQLADLDDVLAPDQEASDS